MKDVRYDMSLTTQFGAQPQGHLVYKSNPVITPLLNTQTKVNIALWQTFKHS